MSEHEKQTAPTPKIDFDEPGLLSESEMSYAEQRQLIEEAIGKGLTSAFKNNAEFVTTNEAGQELLRLRIPSRQGEDAPVTIAQEMDADGKRTAYLAFEAGWENYWKYEDGPGQTGRITPYTKDPETGELIPKLPEHDATYDPTTDYEVAFWSKRWVNNLDKGRPEIPRSRSRMGAFGGAVLKRFKRQKQRQEKSSDQTSSETPEAMAVEPSGPTPHSPERVNDTETQHERRARLEEDLGDALTLAFDEHDRYVSTPQNGIEQLTLRVPYRERKEAFFSCARKIHEGEPNNHRTVMMALRHKKDGELYWRFDDWKFEDGSRKSSLIPCMKNPDGPGIVPRPAPEPGSHPTYDPTSDREVANVIEHYLLHNLEGEPVMPNKDDRKPR